MSNNHDVLQTLAGYAPSAMSVSTEWSTARMNDTLADIVGDGSLTSGKGGGSAEHEIPLRFVPAAPGSRRRRLARALPVAASIALLAVGASAIVALLPSATSGNQAPAGALGPAFIPPAGLSNTSLAPGEYSYRVDEQISLDASGKRLPPSLPATSAKSTGGVSVDAPQMIDRNWISPNGDIVSFRTGDHDGCFTFAHSEEPSFTVPTQSFLESLPTDVDALNTYVRAHVSGSSSREEAVFVAVGDALRTADGLASPRLRGAFVAVLSHTRGVIVHENQRDYLGRAAIRADFVDERRRPGEIKSLYFDPTTFQLLEERSGNTSKQPPNNFPSAPYDGPVAPGDSPADLTGTAFIDVMTAEKVVDKPPTIPADCEKD